ncbi:hypothetical protein FRB97_004085 [Tulasnella sp. 331]|nr:hypothetical protein FRB97_004085 [Tulasnella sp. 331]
MAPRTTSTQKVKPQKGSNAKETSKKQTKRKKKDPVKNAADTDDEAENERPPTKVAKWKSQKKKEAKDQANSDEEGSGRAVKYVLYLNFIYYSLMTLQSRKDSSPVVAPLLQQLMDHPVYGVAYASAALAKDKAVWATKIKNWLKQLTDLTRATTEKLEQTSQGIQTEEDAAAIESNKFQSMWSKCNSFGQMNGD